MNRRHRARSLAVALALSLLPAAARAQTSPHASEGGSVHLQASEPFSLGVMIGPAFDDPTSFKLRFDGSLALARLSPHVRLDGVLSMGFSFSDLFRFDLAPAARFVFAVARDVAAYADFGLGFSIRSYGAGSFGSGLIKLAGGIWYDLAPHWRVIAEPVGRNFYYAGGDGFVYTLLFGAAYRF
jgi:hypothetical protein